MEEHEIELAIKMLTYAVFTSKQSQDLKAQDVIYHLRFFFSADVLDEAKRRITTAST